MDNITPEIKFVTDDIRQKSEELVLNPLPKTTQSGFLDFAIKEETGKRKLQDYSDVKFTDIYAKLEDESYISKFPSYSTSGGNQEEYFAEQQTTGEKWKNGTVKFLGQIYTGVLGGTIGMLNGAYEFAKTGSFAATYDNDFSNYLDGLNKKWDYQLPNYYTQSEKDAGLVDSLGSANFWAKDVLGGAAFTLSAIGSEAIWAWATGGTSLSTSAARLAPKIGRLGRISEAVLGSSDDILRAANLAKTETKLPIITTGTNLFKNVKVPTQLASGLGKTGDLINTARFTYTSAGFEAGFEARHYMREMEDSFYYDFQAKNNGEMPSYEEEMKFRKELGDSANALYGFNLAVVGTSNLATIGRIYNIKSPLSAPSKWTNAKLFGVGVTSAEGELTQIVATKGQKLAQKAFTLGKSPITEGLWEEGMQSVGANTAKNWVESGYNPTLTRETYDLGQASIDGFAETYGTKEGWKEIGVGMIIGLLTGSGISAVKGGELKDAKEKAANLENFSRYYSPKKMAEAISYANRTQDATKNAEVAESKGDFTSAELSRKSAVLSQLNFAYNLDYLKDTINETTIAIDNINNESLMKEYDVDEAGAEALRKKMKEEYISTARDYKKNRDFSEYYIGQKASKENLTIEETSNLKQAIAYELTLGSEAYKFSSDILNSLKQKIAGGYIDAELTAAIDIDNVLLTASIDVKREFEAKTNELLKTKEQKQQLETKRNNLLKVLLDESQEQKVARLQQLNNVEVELSELEVKRDQLAKEADATFAAAQLNNPFNTNPSQQFLTSEQIENLNTNLNKVRDLSESFRSVDPQKALEVQKLRQEYARSIAAFQRYADLARQLSDPKLGLRGKRNIIAEIRSDKTPNEITVETLRGLKGTREQLKVEGATRVLESAKIVQESLEDSKKEAASMEIKAPKAGAEVVEKSAVKEAPVDTIKRVIAENPYLLSYNGIESPVKPTEQEVSEYYTLATQALQSPNFNPETIGMGGQLQLFSTGENLTSEELDRLQELNQKMSDWQLYGGAMNANNLSITDIIEQQLLLDQEVEVEESVEVTEDEIGAMSEQNPKQVEGDDIRPEDMGQTYSRVFVKNTKYGYMISNLGIQKFLDGLDIADEVVVVMDGKPMNVSREAVSNHSSVGHKIIVTFRDGTETEISIEPGGVLKIEDFNKIKNNSKYTIDKYVLGKQSSYSLLYLGDTQVESDFFRIDEGLSYTDTELYNLQPEKEGISADFIGFQVNLDDPYNVEELKKGKGKKNIENLTANLKIYMVDSQGNILGDVKANRNTGNSPNFLKLRAKAVEMATTKGVKGIITLPYQAPLKHLFLGSPNLEFEGDGYKTFPIISEAIVDFGYTQGGKLVLNGETEKVRKDFISKILKRDGVPVIVFRRGNYNIAFPVKLKKTNKNLEVKVNEILENTKSAAEAVVQINKLLLENKLSPKNYNLYYTDASNQSMFNEEGGFSEGLQKAISDLSVKEDFVNPRNWTSKEDVVNSADINIDLSNNPIVSPKPIIDLNTLLEIKGDWYEEFKKTGELSEEKITEIANKIAYREVLTVKEYDLSDYPTIVGKVEEIYEIEKAQKGEAKNNLEKPC